MLSQKSASDSDDTICISFCFKCCAPNHYDSFAFFIYRDAKVLAYFLSGTKAGDCCTISFCNDIAIAPSIFTLIKRAVGTLNYIPQCLIPHYMRNPHGDVQC
jgi:hypothetical protein